MQDRIPISTVVKLLSLPHTEVKLGDASSRRAEYSHTNTDKKPLALPIWALPSLIVVGQPSIV